MADQLYLSLWFPNFQLASLPAALTAVLNQFAKIASSPAVHAATVYPLSWNESPIYQRIYKDEEAPQPTAAVAAATDPLHEDYAYEFEMRWTLWSPEIAAGLDPTWRQETRVVRVTGFGPLFDEGSYQQNGQIRLDLGPDTPFLEDEIELDKTGIEVVRRNIEKLVALTMLVEKECGAATRMLWSETGGSLAQKLIARLQRVN